jgi:hypothetical protein
VVDPAEMAKTGLNLWRDRWTKRAGTATPRSLLSLLAASPTAFSTGKEPMSANLIPLAFVAVSILSLLVLAADANVG